MNIPKHNLNPKMVSFSGHSKSLDKTGYVVQHFYYMYDPEKYDCEVELYNLLRDSKGNMNVETPNNPQAVIKMNGGYTTEADMFNYPEVDSELGFAYRFKLTDKKTKQTSYAFDNGTVIGIFDNKEGNEYNVILNNRAVINKNGPMQLIMPDGYYPGIENVGGNPKLNESLRAQALASVRTHANKLGGNFYGIIARLGQLEKEGIKRIVGTPYTKDTISSHKYWTENAYQVSPEFGNEEEFKTLITSLFEHDINWIADAALVNEGFGGIHISEFLRKGDESFSKNMFRTDEIRSLGIIPNDCEFTKMKIINAPFEISKDGIYNDKNPNYNPSKPTYVQFIDERLATEEQQKSNSPKSCTTYGNKNTDNIYDITAHDDAVYPFPIEVNPQELHRNAKNIAKEHGEIDLKDIETMKNLTDFSNFNITTKSTAAGIEVWDGNVDIAKLNFYRCDKDDARFSKLPASERREAIDDFDRGSLAVKDYAINSGKYWTKLVSDTLLAYVSDSFGKADIKDANGYLKEIKSLVQKGKLPKSVLDNVDIDIIQNVIDNNYHIISLDDMDMRDKINPEGYGNDYSVSDYIMRKAMDYPLENLPFATNLLGVVTSPYIAKKANTDEELGVSRYDVAKAGNPNLPKKYANVYKQADGLYKDEIVPFITEVLSGVQGLSEDYMVSDFGKYIINDITPDLTKYLFIKAINPKADIKVSNDGKFDFSKIDDSDYTIQSIGIPYSGMSLEQEAQNVVNILKKGMHNISAAEKADITAKIKNRYNSKKLNDYKIAEMIIDRTEAGLGWRIDATKDIAAVDSVRSDADSMAQTWLNVIDFWKRYNSSVLGINRHAFTTAEITDLYDLFSKELGTIFTSDGDAERKFLEETGITSVANYNYFFSLLPEMFSNYSFETGNMNWRMADGKPLNINDLGGKLDTGWSGTNPGFLFQSPDDGVKNSYTFFGNHDKPRALHCLALNMELFNTSFAKRYSKKELAAITNQEEKDKALRHNAYFEIAADVLKTDVSRINDKVNPKAIAMGSRLKTAFKEVLKNDPYLLPDIEDAIADLASGNFKGRKFDPDAFGTRDFKTAIQSVLDQVQHKKCSMIPNENRADIEAEVAKNILMPAFDRFYSMYKLLMVLPGSPTDFAGDRVGNSGYETKTKNYHQQNRNIINWEWLEDERYKFVLDHYNKSNEIANLRSNKKLQALNDGDTVTLPIAIQTKNDKGESEIKNHEQISAMLRYNDKNIVIALSDLSGVNTDYTKPMQRGTSETSTEAGVIYNRIVLNAETAQLKQGLKHGLKPGTIFKNERSEDDTIYKIYTMVKDDKEYYYLRREDKDGKELPIKIEPEDFNTLILYKE